MAFAIASVIVASALFVGCRSAEAATAEPNSVPSLYLPKDVVQRVGAYCDVRAMCRLSETNQENCDALQETKIIRQKQWEELQVLQIFRGLMNMMQSVMDDDHPPNWYQFVAESVESFDVLPLSSCADIPIERIGVILAKSIADSKSKMGKHHKSRNIQIENAVVSDPIHSVVHSDSIALIPMDQHITCSGDISCKYHIDHLRWNSNGDGRCGLYHDTLQTAEGNEESAVTEWFIMYISGSFHSRIWRIFDTDLRWRYLLRGVFP